MRHAYTREDGVHVILTIAEFHAIYKLLLEESSEEGLLNEMEDVALLLEMGNQLDNL